MLAISHWPKIDAFIPRKIVPKAFRISHYLSVMYIKANNRKLSVLFFWPIP